MASSRTTCGVVALLFAFALPAFAQQAVERERIAAAVSSEKRPWGPEQATGAPDTPEAGDFPTAWASLHPESGVQWLELTFEKAVKVGEVRITESFNPGAVVKVSAVLSGNKEETLWVGNDLTVEAPDDFVVAVQQEITADKLRVYVDTSLTPGWEEIDAVELVGKDGSRQWAKSATASSTYAERGEVHFLAPPPAGPFAPFVGRKVTVHLDGGNRVEGTFRSAADGFLLVQDGDQRTLLVNVQKVVYVTVEKAE